jgi:integrase
VCPQRPEDGDPAEPGHNEVGDHEVERWVVSLNCRQRGFAVGCFDNRERWIRFQHAAHHAANLRLVVHDEHGAACRLESPALGNYRARREVRRGAALRRALRRVLIGRNSLHLRAGRRIRQTLEAAALNPCPAYAKDHLPTARLWRESLTRFTVSDWHRATVKGLKLPPYPLKNARHQLGYADAAGWGAGAQAQLGHSTAKPTLDTYGRWLPRSEDRARAEAQVARAEAAGSCVQSHVHLGSAETSSDLTSSVAIAAR